MYTEIGAFSVSTHQDVRAAIKKMRCVKKVRGVSKKDLAAWIIKGRR